MTFPYQNNDGAQPLGMEGILRGVASANNGTPVLVVSTANAGGTLTFGGDASNNRVSAFQTDGGNLHISAFSNDAGLFRVSSVGSSGSSNDLLIDGRNNAISATIIQSNFLLSGIATSARDSLFTRLYSLEADQVMVSAKSNDGGLFRASALVGNSLSAAAQNFVVSAVNGDAGTFHASAFVDSGSVSARSGDANQVHVSAVQGDAGLLHTSALVSNSLSAAAQNFIVSAVNGDAGTLHTSAFVDSGSVSARSGDANQVHVSAVQGDAGLLHTSAYLSVATTNTGGASFFSTSAGIAQVSTVKNAAGRLYGYHLGNPAGVDQYLQIFNASGGATLGTDVPTLTLYIPTLGGAVMSLGDGIGFSNGIQCAVTSTAAGNTAGASGMRVNLFYA